MLRFKMYQLFLNLSFFFQASTRSCRKRRRTPGASVTQLWSRPAFGHVLGTVATVFGNRQADQNVTGASCQRRSRLWQRVRVEFR